MMRMKHDSQNLIGDINTFLQRTFNNSGIPLELLTGESSSDAVRNIVVQFSSALGELSELLESKKTSITENETDDIAADAEQYGYDWICEHYSREDIKDGMGVYQPASDAILKYLNDRLHDEYDFMEDDWEMMYDALIDVIFERINFSNVWSAIDDIMNAPVTIEEKLRDVGVSEKDFL